MKTRLRKDAQLLALFAVLAALPLAIWACGDAGDSPGGPTGPGSRFNPDIDYPGATITTRVNPSTTGPGGTFGILATLRDANGVPIEGAPLFMSAEQGGAIGFFNIVTNPTLTDADGNASIHVFVTDGCPNGSYSFVIATQRTQSARGFAQVKVIGGVGGGAVVNNVTLTASANSVIVNTPVSFNVMADATAACALRYEARLDGGGTPDPVQFILMDECSNLASCNFLVTPTSTLDGPLMVDVRAFCNGDDLNFVADGPVFVSVTP